MGVRWGEGRCGAGGGSDWVMWVWVCRWEGGSGVRVERVPAFDGIHNFSPTTGTVG